MGKKISELSNTSNPNLGAEIPLEHADANYRTTATNLFNSASINNLGDVQTSGSGHTPADGDALVWNSSMNHWMPGSVGASGSGIIRKFTEHTSKIIKISCSTTEAVVFPTDFKPINRISIVYAVGGQPRYHYTLLSFSGRTKILRTEGGSYTLTSTLQSIGRENDAYSIHAMWYQGILYIETGTSSYTNSQFNGGDTNNTFMDANFLVIDA